ncbi:MAG: phage tail tube protein [Clostridia bacterium]|nr:phage tail tube protein [Clostridia bacterium]
MAIVGYASKVMVGSTAVAGTADWSFEGSRDMFDKTSMNDGNNGFKTSIPLLASATGSVNLKYADPTDAGQTALRNAWLQGTLATVELYEDSTHKWSGSVYITSLSSKSSVEGVATGSFNFQFNGAPTFA